jgi:hypothetical protein
MERRRMGRDQRRRLNRDRRMGRDLGEENLTAPNSLQEMEQRREGEDRRGRAHDMAMDATTGFDARYPGVRNRYR